MNNIRVFYKKQGRAKYISHLDITRCMQRALKRAKLPVWYTEGFNPHMYITFALPLSLGYESESETMDLRLTEELSFTEVRDRLNAALPEGIEVTDVREPKFKADAITSAVYRIELSSESVSVKELSEKFSEFMQSDKIEVEKHTKRGMKTIDIKEDVELVSSYEGSDCLVLRLKTSAGIQKNINPTLAIDEFIKRNELQDMLIKVNKKAVLMENGEEFC